jgi:HK97 family phage major capsid protein
MYSKHIKIPQKAAEIGGHWFRALAGNERSMNWCISNNIRLEKAGSEYPDSAGGFIVPDSYDASIVNIRETVGAFRAAAEVRPAASDSQVRPRRTGGLTANWVNEGQSIPQSSFLLEAVQSSAKKLAVLFSVSSELWEDSAVDLGAFVANEIGYAFSATEDDAGFNGDGTAAYRGIRGLGTMLTGTKGAVNAASGHSTYLLADSGDIQNVIGAVMGSALPGASWFTSPAGFALLFSRLAGTSGGMFSSVGPNGIVQHSYLGWPIRISGKLPDVSTSLSGQPMLFFGDLSMSSMLVESRRMVVALSTQHAMDQDQYLIRGTQRIDILNHDVGGIAAKGPVAMLVGQS